MNSANSSTSTPFVVQIVGIARRRRVVGRNRRAVRRRLVRLQRAGDPHLVHVGVGGERHQARLLVLPSEASDPRRARSLEHRHVDHLAAHRLPAARSAMFSQRAVGDRLDEAVAEDAEAPAQRRHVRVRMRELLDRDGDRAILDQRSSRRIDEVLAVEPAGPLLHDLAGAAEDRRQVARAAPVGVEDRAETVRDGFGSDEFLELPRRSCIRRRESSASWANSPGRPGRAELLREAV